MGTWHPKEYTFAVAKHNSLFLFTEKRTNSGASKTSAQKGAAAGSAAQNQS